MLLNQDVIGLRNYKEFLKLQYNSAHFVKDNEFLQ